VGTLSRVAPFRVELSLLGFFLLCWLLYFVLAVGDHPLAGTVPIGLYQLYAAAVAGGWVVGNVVVQRSRGWSRAVRRRVLLVLLVSPGGVFYLLWSLSEVSSRAAVPFAPLYAFVVFAVFFLVPVSFRGAFPKR